MQQVLVLDFVLWLPLPVLVLVLCLVVHRRLLLRGG